MTLNRLLIPLTICALMGSLGCNNEQNAIAPDLTPKDDLSVDASLEVKGPNGIQYTISGESYTCDDTRCWEQERVEGEAVVLNYGLSEDEASCQWSCADALGNARHSADTCETAFELAAGLTSCALEVTETDTKNPTLTVTLTGEKADDYALVTSVDAPGALPCSGPQCVYEVDADMPVMLGLIIDGEIRVESVEVSWSGDCRKAANPDPRGPSGISDPGGDERVCQIEIAPIDCTVGTPPVLDDLLVKIHSGGTITEHSFDTSTSPPSLEVESGTKVELVAGRYVMTDSGDWEYVRSWTTYNYRALTKYQWVVNGQDISSDVGCWLLECTLPTSRPGTQVVEYTVWDECDNSTTERFEVNYVDGW